MEKEHILKILKEVQSSLQTKNFFKIKQLSNQVIHQASIEQDSDVVLLAVIIYSLSKILEREHYRKEKNWDKFYKNFLRNLNDMVNALEDDDIEKFRKEIKQNRKLIQKLSGLLKDYIQDVFRKAKINKASKIYEHGISMEKTAKMLGITIWELAEYAGQTGVSDVNFSITMPIKERIKIAEEIFG